MPQQKQKHVRGSADTGTPLPDGARRDDVFGEGMDPLAMLKAMESTQGGPGSSTHVPLPAYKMVRNQQHMLRRQRRGHHADSMDSADNSMGQGRAQGRGRARGRGRGRGRPPAFGRGGRGGRKGRGVVPMDVSGDDDDALEEDESTSQSSLSSDEESAEGEGGRGAEEEEWYVQNPGRIHTHTHTHHCHIHHTPPPQHRTSDDDLLEHHEEILNTPGYPAAVKKKIRAKLRRKRYGVPPCPKTPMGGGYCVCLGGGWCIEGITMCYGGG